MKTSNLTPSAYRCEKACNNCPFMDDGKAIHLEKGRVDAIKETLLSSDSGSFNCHKTVYNLDENMEASEPQELKMCYGAYKFLRENGRANMQMRLAYALGIDTPPNEGE